MLYMFDNFTENKCWSTWNGTCYFSIKYSKIFSYMFYKADFVFFLCSVI